MSRKQQALAVTVLAGLYAVLKLNSVGVLPCEAPGGDPCAPGDEAIALVPANALFYAHATTDRDSQQFDQAADLSKRLPHAAALIRSAVATLGAPSGAAVDVRRHIEPWLGDEVALARWAGKRELRSTLILASDDDRRALAFADRVGPGKPRAKKVRNSSLRLYGGGFAAALTRGFLVLGNAGAVRETIDVADPAPKRPLKIPEPPHPSLASSRAASAIRAELPENRLADVYLPRQGVKRFLARAGGYAPQLDTFSDYAATRGIAAAAVAHEDGVEFRLVSALNRKLAKKHPPALGALAPFQPTLAQEVSDQALLYVGVGKLGQGLQGLLRQARRTSPRLALSLARFQRRLSATAQVRIARQLLPLLGGEGALAIEPRAKVPYLSLIVDGVDEKGAGKTIAKLARPIAEAAGRQRRGIAGSIGQRKIAGIEATTVRLSPSVNLSFAVFDGKLVVSSDPAGIVEVRRGDEHLSGKSEYRRAIRGTGEEVSALVFVNLKQLLALAERAGLTSNPAYATFREDIHRLKALGIGASSTRDLLRTRVFLNIDD